VPVLKTSPTRGSVTVRVSVRNTSECQFSKNSPTRESVRVKIRVRVRTPRRVSVRVRTPSCGTVRVKSMG